MDFLANENFPVLSVRLLREAGHRVISFMSLADDSQEIKALLISRLESMIDILKHPWSTGPNLILPRVRQ